jgi:hypothetical protein
MMPSQPHAAGQRPSARGPSPEKITASGAESGAVRWAYRIFRLIRSPPGERLARPRSLGRRWLRQGIIGGGRFRYCHCRSCHYRYCRCRYGHCHCRSCHYRFHYCRYRYSHCRFHYCRYRYSHYRFHYCRCRYSHYRFH